MFACPRSSHALRRLRPPRENGHALFEPPLVAVPTVLKANSHRARRYDYDVQGRSLVELAVTARRELVTQARDYTRRYRDVDVPAANPLEHVLLAGHQPELFHPGVWLKNFVLGSLAERLGGMAINLLIDSDTIKSTAVRVPGGSVAAPTAVPVCFDRPGLPIPHEERKVLDRALFREFGRHAAKTLRPLVPDPVLAQYWPLAVGRSEETDVLGQCLAQARHQLEGAWGLSTWELPQSTVCRFEAFHWFTAHLLAQLPRLWKSYNGGVAEYRRVHRVRSRAHPVPDLASADGWLEAPFWIWNADEPRRRPLFVRPRGNQLVLSDRGKLEIPLRLSSDSEARRATEELADLPRRTIKLRPRATITTMFARLFLGDVFVHGIGGAKYDELTDQLIRQFFGLEPPDYLIVSATVRLPISHHRVTADDRHHVQEMLRQLAFHPERHIRPEDVRTTEERQEVDRLVKQKEAWIATPATLDNGRARHRGIARANAALARWVSDQQRELLARQQRLASVLHNEAILSSREYAFCLHSRENLRKMMRNLCADDHDGVS